MTADLLALQNSEPKGATRSHLDASGILSLRQRVPSAILAQFDQMRVRGKKAITVVRNGVCGECHMTIPTGTLRRAENGSEIQLCGSCGRYIHLPEAAAAPLPVPAAPIVAAKAPKPARRKKTAVIHVIEPVAEVPQSR